ncbi:ketosteroid isomerase [Serratia plymuthica]|uniref:nuclear transport factor 2 family protein n=1 Tax=Serratia plymuthica TaxID=82996 RepID=UPI00079FDAEE|nr:nuclear transport factor 2 family protein [Serratia plymuthica]KYQ97131.1 ketosteroid isomerase [Serratia plymuthica]
MTDAKTLLLDVLAAIPDGEKCAEFFAEDGVLELPFLHSLGIPVRHEGRKAIADFYNFVSNTLYPGFSFRPENIAVLIETPDKVFAEYQTEARAASTGRIIHHLFAGYVVAEGGKIKLLRESLNTVAAAQALNPNGVADLPVPETKILSVPAEHKS